MIIEVLEFSRIYIGGEDWIGLILKEIECRL